MTDLQTCIDQNFTDLSDSEGVLAGLLAGDPSIWENYWAGPHEAPTLIEVQSAISIVQPIKDARAWKNAMVDSVLGASSEEKTIAVLKAEIQEFDL
jgi:hypothetical protein